MNIIMKPRRTLRSVINLQPDIIVIFGTSGYDACCVLNRKLHISELKKLPSGGRAEFNVEITEEIKNQIQKIVEE